MNLNQLYYFKTFGRIRTLYKSCRKAEYFTAYPKSFHRCDGNVGASFSKNRGEMWC